MTTKIMTAAAAVALMIACPSFAAELRPDQQEAVEKMLAQMEPSMREPFRTQIEQSVAMLTKEQVAALVASMESDGAGEAEAETYEEEEAPVLSPEDYAYNRKQFEPAIRKSWAAQKAFDDHVDAELAAKCPGRDQYAVFGSAVRYEVRQLAPNWPRASVSADTDVTVLAASYAPQDGRYDFDFSDVRTRYDAAAVDRAIAKACGDWTKLAAEFHAKASAQFKADDLDGAYKTEQQYGPKVTPIETELDAALNREAPAANNAVFMALMNGTRVK